MKRGISIISMKPQAQVVRDLLTLISYNAKRCPAHASYGPPLMRPPSFSDSALKNEYAFEINNAAGVRFGKGVTKEVGMDVTNMGLKRVLVITDKNLVNKSPLIQTVDSLTRSKIQFEVFDAIRIEPSEASLRTAIHKGQVGQYDGFIAVGGGSVMDTAKVVSLMDAYRDKDIYDFVNAPIGKGLPITRKLKPLICIPTTAGTGSETTGVAIFEVSDKKYKTGIGNRAITPKLALVDPLNSQYMPENVAIYSGFDVLCHALEAYTALPFYARVCPENPQLRPLYQGSTPITDIFAEYALSLIKNNFVESIKFQDNEEARANMCLASLVAGMGLGSAGAHLCHAMSYPISGNVKDYTPEGYVTDHSLIPHGLSVCITAPAVFAYTAVANQDKHLRSAALLGKSIKGCLRADAGEILSDTVRGYMEKLGICNGIRGLGYERDDIPSLVEGTLPQKRLLNTSPIATAYTIIWKLLENSLTVY